MEWRLPDSERVLLQQAQPEAEAAHLFHQRQFLARPRWQAGAGTRRRDRPWAQPVVLRFVEVGALPAPHQGLSLGLAAGFGRPGEHAVKGHGIGACLAGPLVVFGLGRGY